MNSTTDVKVPDIGDSKAVAIIEILVKPGDTIKADQSLITLESDKASMEIPAPSAGVVEAIKVKLGDKVSEGDVILTLRSETGAEKPDAAQSAAESESPAAAEPLDEKNTVKPDAAPADTTATPESSSPTTGASDATSDATPAAASSVPSDSPKPEVSEATDATDASSPPEEKEITLPHASPSIRKFARELGVDLRKIKGAGPKGRITADDVKAYVKEAVAAMVNPAGGTGGRQGNLFEGLLPWPKVDFEKFGPIVSQPLQRIKKLSGANLHRNWVMIPHVTNHDVADITELEKFRVTLNSENEKSGIKLTLLAFLIKACVSALKKFPDFNSSLNGEQLILKQYYHIGFAADTPNGLMVPVIRDADKKGLTEIAQDAAALAKKARDGKLSPADMQGGSFSISSLGGIGGTYFTPIVNAPEVAILGVCKAALQPVWNGEQFAPRLILPLSLSWDHRVVDGASAARFNVHLANLLADFRRISL